MRRLQGQPMLEIIHPADRPELLPDLARWFEREWADYYAGRVPGGPTEPVPLSQIEADLRPWLQRSSLPQGLVALDEGQIAGSIALREHALHTQPQFRPGLGGLHVSEPFRGRGIAAGLLRAGVLLAADLGYETVYISTSVVGDLLLRLGWQELETVIHYGEPQTLYRRVLR